MSTTTVFQLSCFPHLSYARPTSYASSPGSLPSSHRPADRPSHRPTNAPLVPRQRPSDRPPHRPARMFHTFPHHVSQDLVIVVSPCVGLGSFTDLLSERLELFITGTVSYRWIAGFFTPSRLTDFVDVDVQRYVIIHRPSMTISLTASSSLSVH